MPEPSDGFFFDLPYSFPCKAELFANFFQGHGMFTIEAKVKSNHIGFALGKGG